ncbi:hypothetical protein COLO4_06132 [Corchorus olitorius]|uniref:Uncharacterized protein n=1 Tax=Corchorus olitorius TaxID=93759 RepID=A0A1R3KP47_9ROSI|nr:hypothetical protein COLO4_06132 [Corchorus olitorius]
MKISERLKSEHAASGTGADGACAKGRRGAFYNLLRRILTEASAEPGVAMTGRGGRSGGIRLLEMFLRREQGSILGVIQALPPPEINFVPLKQSEFHMIQRK